VTSLVGYSHEQRNQAMWAIAIVVVITSLLAIGQAVLSPDLLGVTPVAGQSGEGTRLGSLVRDPNILGTLIGLALPFTMYSLVRLPAGRNRWLVAGAAVVLALALLLTYSRGSWLGVLVGFGIVSLIIDRRALVVFIGVLAVAYVTAVIMPKGILAGGVAAPGYDPFATTVNRIQNVSQGRDLRWRLITNAVPIVEAHPLLGVGPGRYGGAAASIFGSPIHEQYGIDDMLFNQKTVDNFWLLPGSNRDGPLCAGPGAPARGGQPVRGPGRDRVSGCHPVRGDGDDDASRGQHRGLPVLVHVGPRLADADRVGQN
jgi:O-antigen ligase